MKKKCSKCRRSKLINQYSKNKSQEDGYQRSCKKCLAKEQSKSYRKHKKKYIKRERAYKKNKKLKIEIYKEERGCKKCGLKEHYCLTFHHLDPEQKKFNISNTYGAVSAETLMEEISKCIVLCFNCHHKFHYLERTQKITIEQYLK